MIESIIADYQVDSLALPSGNRPRLDSLLGSGFYEDQRYDYYAIVSNSNQAAPSPQTDAFDPYHIPRIQATPEAVAAWLAFYQDNPGAYYVASGAIPNIEPASAQ